MRLATGQDIWGYGAGFVMGGWWWEPEIVQGLRLKNKELTEIRRTPERRGEIEFILGWVGRGMWRIWHWKRRG